MRDTPEGKFLIWDLAALMRFRSLTDPPIRLHPIPRQAAIAVKASWKEKDMDISSLLTHKEKSPSEEGLSWPIWMASVIKF
jgi:hypothetical protein